MEENLSSLRLTGALVGLARALSSESSVPPAAADIIRAGLAAQSTDAAALDDLTRQVHDQKDLIVPNCKWCASPCGRTADFDLTELDRQAPEVRELKLRILSSARAVARRGAGGSDTDLFLCRALFALGEDWDAGFLGALDREARERAGA